MKKSKGNTKILKKKMLLALFKKESVRRIAPNALIALEKKIAEQLTRIAKLLKERALSRGRKTVKEEDIQAIFEQREEYKEI